MCTRRGKTDGRTARECAHREGRLTLAFKAWLLCPHSKESLGLSGTALERQGSGQGVTLHFEDHVTYQLTLYTRGTLLYCGSVVLRSLQFLCSSQGQFVVPVTKEHTGILVIILPLVINNDEAWCWNRLFCAVEPGP